LKSVKSSFVALTRHWWNHAWQNTTQIPLLPCPWKTESTPPLAKKSMNWQVVSRPEAENDVIEIAAWYDSRSENLGDRFVEEFLTVLDELTINPLAALPPTIRTRIFAGATLRAFRTG